MSEVVEVPRGSVRETAWGVGMVSCHALKLVSGVQVVVRCTPRPLPALTAYPIRRKKRGAVPTGGEGRVSECV